MDGAAPPVGHRPPVGAGPASAILMSSRGPRSSAGPTKDAIPGRPRPSAVKVVRRTSRPCLWLVHTPPKRAIPGPAFWSGFSAHATGPRSKFEPFRRSPSSSVLSCSFMSSSPSFVLTHSMLSRPGRMPTMPPSPCRPSSPCCGPGGGCAGCRGSSAAPAPPPPQGPPLAHSDGLVRRTVFPMMSFSSLSLVVFFMSLIPPFSYSQGPIFPCRLSSEQSVQGPRECLLPLLCELNTVEVVSPA